MIDIKKVMENIGVPPKLVSKILAYSAVASCTLVGYHFFENRETKLNTTVQYMPESKRMDSLIISKLTHIENKYDSRFDTISKGIKTMSAVMKSYNTVTNQKFNFLIEHNSAFKTYFDGLDNSLNCLIQLLPQSTFYEKKKDLQFYQLAEQF